MTGKAKTLLKYVITVAVCILMGVLYLMGREYDDVTKQDIIRYISDAFSVPGVITILVGLLITVSNEGAFYGVGYALSSAGKALLPGGRLKTEKYADYVERKSGNKITGFGFLFFVGGAFLIVGLIFMAIYNFM